MKMKQVNEFKALSPKERAKNVVSFARKSMDSKKLLTKVLIAGEEIGDFGRGNGQMAAYAKQVTSYPESTDEESGIVTPAFEGIDLRRDVQGTYEYANVLRGIREGKLAMSEVEFDSDVFGSNGLIQLSGFMSKSPEKVSEALEIIRSRNDVTNRLKALRDSGKEKKEAESKESGDGTETDVPEIQTPDSTTYVVPLEMAIMSHEELMADLMAEVKGAATIADCETYIRNFEQLRAMAESRREALEFEALEMAEFARQLAVA